MKKIIPGIVCLLLITSCDFEMPKSLTVKGSPGLYVPLGSPFVGMKPEERLENLIGPDNVKNMLDGSSAEAGIGKELKIYEVDKSLATPLKMDPDVQAYVARYPLADMPLNLKKYAEDAMKAVNDRRQFTIPDLSSLPIPPTSASPVFMTEDGPERTDNDKPFIKVSLVDMAKLVKLVKAEDILGLEIDYFADLATNLELRIPGLGIETWTKGTATDDNGNPSSNPTKLRYYNPAKRYFYPRVQRDTAGTVTQPSDLDAKGNLLIYAKISGSLQPKTHVPSLVFKWEMAQIDTVTGTDNKGSFSGEYPLDNNLGKFLGEGVSFKRVDGYMYMSGVHVDEDSTMTIDVYDAKGPEANIIPGYSQKHTLNDVSAPVFPKDGEKFTADNAKFLTDPKLMSITDVPQLDMRDILKAESKKLKVSVQIPGMEIFRDEVEKGDDAIHLDLLVLIPLELEVSNQIPDDIAVDLANGDKYVMLDLGDALKKTSKGGDLFGRKGGEDDALKVIKSVEIGIRFSTNDINIIRPGDLAVLVTSNKRKQIMEFKNNSRLRLTSKEDGLDEIPFSPVFNVLLEKNKNAAGQYETSGSFKILRPAKPSFDFKLDVTAKAELEYTLDF